MSTQLKTFFSPTDQIQQGRTINSWHISQVVEAFTGAEPYLISTDGSFNIKGDLYLQLNNTSPNPSNSFKYLGIDDNTGMVGYYSSIFDIYPLILDPSTHSVYNTGFGDSETNTIFGYGNFVSNNYGLDNSIYGYNNMPNSTGSYNNVAIGIGNLQESKSSIGNIAIGNDNMNVNSGHGNIALGAKVLQSNSSGSYNIGFGDYSLSGNNGNYNIGIGSYSLYNNEGSKNVSIGYKSSHEVELGSNRVSIGYGAGRIPGNHKLEIHSYTDGLEEEDPLIEGDFSNNWLKINGNLRLNINYNPPAVNPSLVPYQLIMDSSGNTYRHQRGYSMSEVNNLFQIKGDYVLLDYLTENYYDNTEINEKFINGENETQTQLLKPEINGNNLTIKYIGEDGQIQSQWVDISSVINDIHIDDADYDAASNIITITRSDGTIFTIDLSEFQLLITTNPDGTTSLNQEGVEKLLLSKVSTTGNFNDLLNKPSTLGGYGIVDSLNTSSQDQTKIGGIQAKFFRTDGGSVNHFVKGDGSLDYNVYLTASDVSGSLGNFVTLNTVQTITADKTFGKLISNVWMKSKQMLYNEINYLHSNLISSHLNENDFTIDWRNSNNSIIHNLLKLNTISKDLELFGNINSQKFITSGGLSSHFVKGDGSLDPNSYITNSALSGYATQTWVSSSLNDYVNKNIHNEVNGDEWNINVFEGGSFEFLGGSSGFPSMNWGNSSAYMSDENVFYVANAGIGVDGLSHFMGSVNFNNISSSPFTVQSDTLVLNLNADKLDGKHASDFLLSSSLNGYATESWVSSSLSNYLVKPVLSNNIIPKWSSSTSNFVNGSIIDSNTEIIINNNITTNNLPRIGSNSYEVGTIITWDSPNYYFTGSMKIESSTNNSPLEVRMINNTRDIKYPLKISNYGEFRPGNGVGIEFHRSHESSSMSSAPIGNVKFVELSDGVSYSISLYDNYWHDDLFSIKSDGNTYIKSSVIGNGISYSNIVHAVNSDDKAALIAPRLTEFVRKSIILDSSHEGAMVYQTDGDKGFYYWDGNKWNLLVFSNFGKTTFKGTYSISAYSSIDIEHNLNTEDVRASFYNLFDKAEVDLSYQRLNQNFIRIHSGNASFDELRVLINIIE